ncbi:MAG: peptidase domain-containing ABC transporter [Alphaproteobacteria bacterium]
MEVTSDTGDKIGPMEGGPATARRQIRISPPDPPRTGSLVLLGSLVVNILSLGLPIVILQVYDRILPNQATDTLFLLVLGLSIVLVLDGVLRFARAYISGWHAMRFEHVANCAAVDRMLASDIATLEAETAGVHLDRLGAIATLRGFYAGESRMIMLDLPFVILFLSLIWAIGGPLVAVPLGIFAVLATAAGFVTLVLRAMLNERASLDERRYSFIIEVLTGIQTVKCWAMEALMQRRYERLQEGGAASTYRVVFVSNLAQAMSTLAANLALAGVAGAGAVFVMRGQLTLGELSACTLLAGRSVQPLLRGLRLWTQFQGLTVALERFSQLFRYPPESVEELEPAPPLNDAITFEDVTFSHEPESPRLLDRVNLRITQGEILAITGDSGNGKTTFLSLIAGILSPTEGRILYDGRDIACYDRGTLRGRIAYIPQSPDLFQGSLMDNLTMFQGPGEIGSSVAAAKQLGLDTIISRLPAGYDTRVGDSVEDEISDGLKQLVVTARGLAKRPDIILFDAANSAVDFASDNALRTTLLGLKDQATIVLVSHRPSLLAIADRLYRLENGRLSDEGGRKSIGAAPERRVGT